MAKIVEVGPSADTGPNPAPSDPNEANTTQDTLTIYHRHDDWLLIWDGYTVREAIQSTALGKYRTNRRLKMKNETDCRRRLAVDIPPILENVMPPEPSDLPVKRACDQVDLPVV